MRNSETKKITIISNKKMFRGSKNRNGCCLPGEIKKPETRSFPINVPLARFLEQTRNHESKLNYRHKECFTENRT